MEIKIGDYVEPIFERGEYTEFLNSLNLKYEDLFGIVSNVKKVSAIEELKFSITIRSVKTGRVTENWDSKIFKVLPITDELRSEYGYMMDIPQPKGTFRI